MDNFNQHNSNGNLPNTTPKQGKTILIIIVVVLIALIGGGLIFG
jgi:flagellar basal body-associated protein FliL